MKNQNDTPRGGQNSNNNYSRTGRNGEKRPYRPEKSGFSGEDGGRRDNKKRSDRDRYSDRPFPGKDGGIFEKHNNRYDRDGQNRRREFSDRDDFSHETSIPEGDERTVREDVICGRNSVLQAVKSGRPCDCIMAAKGEHSGSMGQIIALAAKNGITVKEVSPSKLDYMCPGVAHQGIAFICAAAATVEPEELFKKAEESGEDPFFIICDNIKDPHNLGAIIRTAEAVGAHGVVIPKRRSAGLTAAVSKAASGALECVPVARVTNISAFIDELKSRGVWVYGADMDGELYTTTDLSGPIALVIGSEGEGLGRLIKSKCDGIISCPMCGQVNSLNASVAAGVLMYRVLECRRIKGKN